MPTPHNQTPAQTALILAFLPKVTTMARQIVLRRHPVLETADLVQEGMLGLIDAARRFDPAQGASFSSYAEHRIRGAMRDALRRSGTGGHRASGYDPEAEDFRGRFRRHEQQREHHEGVAAIVLTKNLCEAVTRLMTRHLSARTRQILTWYYVKEWTLATIGRQLGISEGQVSRIHSETLAKLRRHLNVYARRND